MKRTISQVKQKTKTPTGFWCNSTKKHNVNNPPCLDCQNIRKHHETHAN